MRSSSRCTSNFNEVVVAAANIMQIWVNLFPKYKCGYSNNFFMEKALMPHAKANLMSFTVFFSQGWGGDNETAHHDHHRWNKINFCDIFYLFPSAIFSLPHFSNSSHSVTYHSSEVSSPDIIFINNNKSRCTSWILIALSGWFRVSEISHTL